MKIRHLSCAVLAFILSAGVVRADMQVGDKPALSFKDFQTKQKVDLTDYKGKIIIVDFWATWCGPCMGEAPHMVAVNEKYASKGLQFVGISLDEDASSLKRVIAEKKFTWPMSFEGKGWEGATPKAWGITGIPQTFIIGPDGTVLWRGHPAEIDSALETAFKSHPPVLVDPKTLEQAKTTLDQIEKNIADEQPTKAVKLLASISEAAKTDADVATRFTAASDKLQAFGTSELASIDPMVQAQQYSQAVKKLRDLITAFAGTPVATEAKSKLATLSSNPKVQKAIEAQKTEKAADEELTIANKLKADKSNDLAYPKFKAIVKSYPGTPAATEAAAAVKSYESDTTFITQYNLKTNGKKATSLLAFGDGLKAAGKMDEAKAKYQEVIEKFPNSTWAETAKKSLASME